MYSDSSVVMKHQQPPANAASQLLGDIWTTLGPDLGSEILLALFFCAGFALFRLSTMQKYLGSNPKLRGKNFGGKAHTFSKSMAVAKELPEELNSPVPHRHAKAWNQPWTQPQRKPNHGTAASPSPSPSPAANTSAAQAFLQRIRSALQDKQVDAALRTLTSMVAAGHAAPPGCVVAVLRLVRQNGKEQGAAVRALPAGAFTPEAVASILSFAAQCADIALAQETHARAGELRVHLSPFACESLLRCYAASGHCDALEAFDKIIAAQGGAELLENQIAAICAACAEARHVRLAERCVAHARQVFGKLTLTSYSALMKVYGHARLFHKTCGLYASMQQDGVKPDTVAYGSLIRAAVESGQFELARQLFKESGNPDLLNCMSLIRAAGRERDMPKALRLLEELERSPLQVDVAAYNCVLEVCVACGDRKTCQDLLRRMEARGSVDVVSYNTYMKILLAEKRREEVGTVLSDMRARGLHPNVVTYNSMVKAAVDCQDLPGAWKLIHDMETHGVTPDSFTCSILMKSMKQAVNAEDMDGILALVQRAKIVPDEVLVNCLLDACVRLRDVERLTKVLDQFKSDGVVPSPHAYAMLIKAYSHARRPDRVWALWREACGVRGESASGVEAVEANDASDGASGLSEEVFTSMVEACQTVGDLSSAAAVLRQVGPQMKAFLRAPSIFASVVKACVQSKRARLAIDLYEELKELFVCTKVTFNTLIDALVRQDDLDGAAAIFREMAMQGVTPDLITYSTLIKGHCARGDLEQGLQLLGVMQRRGIMPDAVLFNSILDGCAHKQMRTLTEQVLRDMEAAGVAPSNFTISILVKLYGRCGDLPAAVQTVETYPKKFGFQLNAQVYTCLMSSCIAHGDLAEAMRAYQRMLDSNCPTDAKTYQTLLSGCVRHGSLESALVLVENVFAGVGGASIRMLDRDLLESVLLMAVRQGQVAEVAAPLLQRLQDVGICVSERVMSAVRGRGERPRGSSRLSAQRSGEATPTCQRPDMAASEMVLVGGQ